MPSAAEGHNSIRCDLSAIHAEDRRRYSDLVGRLRAAAQDPTEVADGFTCAVDTGRITLVEVAEWMTMERLCCPFLTFRLDVQAGEARLTLGGPEGVKAMLREQLLGL